MHITCLVWTQRSNFVEVTSPDNKLHLWRNVISSSQFEFILKIIWICIKNKGELDQNKASQVSKLMWNEKIVWMSDVHLLGMIIIHHDFPVTRRPGPPSHKVCSTPTYYFLSGNLLSNKQSADHITSHQGPRIYLVFNVSWTTFKTIFSVRGR